MQLPRQVIKDTGSLRVMMTDEGYAMLEQLKEKMIRKWNDGPISGQDAFQTLRAIHRREGKIEGINEFFETLEQEALKS